jgi:diguanylate cyclase (GGDEF)-like protein
MMSNALTSTTNLEYILSQARRHSITRWVGLIILASALLLTSVFNIKPLVFWSSLGVIATAAVTNIFFSLSYARLQSNQARSPEWRYRHLHILLYLHTTIDLILITIGIYVSGGSFNPVTIFYLLYTGALATFFPLNALIVIILVSSGLFIGLTEATLAGVIKPFSPGLGVDMSTIPPFILRTSEVLYVGMMMLNGFVVYSLSHRLRRSWADADSQRIFLDHLHQLTRLSLRYTNLPELYQTLTDQLCHVLEADGCYLTLWDDQKKEVIPAAASGNLSASFRNMQFDPGEPDLTESLRRSGTPLSVEDVFHSPYISPKVAAHFPAHSLLGLPLFNYLDNHFLGAVLVAYNQPHRFTAEEIEHAQQAVDVGILMLSRAGLHQETHQRAVLLQKLVSHVSRLTGSLDQATLLPVIVDGARELLKSDRAAIYLNSPDVDSMACFHSVGLSQHYIDGFNTRIRRAPGSTILRGGSYYIVEDAWQDPRSSPIHDLIVIENIHAYAAFELPSPEDPLGALVVYWDEPHSFSQEEVAVATLFASRAGAALHNAQLHALVIQEARTDSLTGLPNRRALDERIEDEIRRAARYQHPFTLFMMDLDGFKYINDTYGHPAGDIVLREVAGNLRFAVRETDFVARYGGDEFAIILPETDLTTASTVADKVCQAVAKIKIDLPNLIQASISLGIAGFPDDARDADTLLKIADRALYRAKTTSPSTIIYAHDPVAVPKLANPLP